MGGHRARSKFPGVSSSTRGRGSRPSRTASGPEVMIEGLLALLHLYLTFIRQKKRFPSLQARRNATWSVAWGPLGRGGPSRGGRAAPSAPWLCGDTIGGVEE